MAYLVAGIDASPNRIGWAFVTLEEGEPVACGCEVVNLPANGWRHGPVQDALRSIDRYGEVCVTFAEYPISRFPRASFDNGRMLGITQAEVERRWPHAPWQELRPGEWRVLAGLPGNATKQEVRDEAFGRFLAANLGGAVDGVPHAVESQDAADALLIAIAGQKRNQESWTRGVERGAA